MAGKMITIPYRYGVEEPLKVLFSFDYDSRHFFVALDPMDYGLVCREMKWNIFRGTYQLSKPLPQDILDVSDSLFDKADEDPDYFALDGEHYRVKKIHKKGKTEYKHIKKPSGSLYLKKFMLNFSSLTGFVIAMVFAALYAFYYIKTYGIMWATMVFPGMHRIPLRITLYMIELAGAAILFMFRDEDPMIVDYIGNALIPLNLITIIGLAKANIAARIVILILCVLFAVFYMLPFIYSVMHRIPNQKKKVLWALRRMYIPIMISVLCCLGAVYIFGINGYTHTASTKFSYSDAESIRTHYEEALKSINENVWRDLTPQQRIDALQSICDYECVNTFGCKTVTVQAGYPIGENVIGQYNSIMDTILINVDYLNEDAVSDVVETLLHETRHVYQQRVVKALDDVEAKLDDEDMRLSFFRYALSIRESFDKYTNGSSNFGYYYNQSAEEDSRSWAEYEMRNVYEWYIYKDSFDEEGSAE